MYLSCCFLQLMKTIQTIPVPVIAQVSGLATAAGCQLVASCDIAVASDTSKFATPGVNVGLFCSTPAVALGRAVPRKVRMHLLLLLLILFLICNQSQACLIPLVSISENVYCVYECVLSVWQKLHIMCECIPCFGLLK